MNVGFLINDITGLGGTERMTALIANQLHRAGLKVTIFTLCAVEGQPFFPIEPGVELVKVGAWMQPSAAQRYLWANFRLLPLLRQRRIAQLIVSDTQLSFSSLLARLMSPVRLVAWEHFNSQTESLLGSRWFGRRLAAWCFHAVVVLTEQDRRSWLRKYVCRAPIRVIRNPSPVPPRDPATRAPGGAGKVVVGVGRMTRQKGFDLLVRAWKQIDAGVRSGWTLALVGPRGSAQAEVEAVRDELGLSAEVELRGATEDMVAVYDQADIYALSSRYEGFSLTLVEALSRGLPAVAFDCPAGPGEILEMGRHGVVVAAEDVSALAQALQSLMQDEDLRAGYARKAYQRSLNYRPESVVGDWMELLGSSRP